MAGVSDLGKSEGTGLVAKADSSAWTLGCSGGVFSALGAAILGVKKLLLCLVEMDLGRRFRSDAVDMVPKNRDSLVFSALLFFGFIVSETELDGERERIRESCTDFEFEWAEREREESVIFMWRSK